MPFTTDITTISVVVAMTTPSRVRNDRSLWVRSSSSASQNASRAGTQKEARGRDFARPAMVVPAWLRTDILAVRMARAWSFAVRTDSAPAVLDETQTFSQGEPAAIPRFLFSLQ